MNEVKRTSIILYLVAAAAFFAAPVSATQQYVIPFRITSTGHLVVDMSVNGTSGTGAILDTAATFPVIDDGVANRLGISPGDAPATVDIIGIGPVSTFPVMDVTSLSFGDIEISGIKAAYNATFDLPGERNIIPSNSLPFRTLDFDFKRSRLLAYDRKPRSIFRATTSRMPLIWTEGLPFIQVRVNGQEGLALIDTGANVSYINSVFANGAARSRKDFRSVELTGVTGNSVVMSVLASREFQIGDFEVKRFNVIVSDPEFLTAIGLEDQPIMVIGVDILSNFRLQIDRVDHELYLSKPDERPRHGPGMTIYSDR
ncbi:aspartyl protease family protein [Henriciella sp.]|uniref:aspartyl protease family protein n=1 Tax=Henriciella sp. TaxID=1968823 RepID=UPI00260B1879|nr:aspartyl protease family protein [Henriciella sp.]